MSDPLTLIETATAACPSATMLFAGLTETAETALATLIGAYTDGYKVTVVETHATARWAAYAIDADSYVSAMIYGRGTLTATAPGSFGAYVVETSIGADASGVRGNSVVAGDAGFVGTASTDYITTMTGTDDVSA